MNEKTEQYCEDCGSILVDCGYVGEYCSNDECRIKTMRETYKKIRSQPTEYEKGFEDGKKARLKWLPIESAPKDGTMILGAGKGANHGTDAIFWSDAQDTHYKIPGWYDEGVRANMTCERPYEDGHITHWIPLPPAPEVSGEG